MELFVIGESRIWVDGGHNEGAAMELVPWIKKALGRPRSLVFGMMSDKDVAAAVALHGLLARFLLARSDRARAVVLCLDILMLRRHLGHVVILVTRSCASP